MFTWDKIKMVLLIFGLALSVAGCGRSNQQSSGGSSGGSPVALTSCVTLNCASAPDNKGFYSQVSNKAFDHHR